MYPVSDDFRCAVKQPVRTFDLNIGTQIADQSFIIPERDTVKDSFYVSESCMKNDYMDIGAFVSATMHAIIDNKDGTYDNYDFSNAVFSPQVGLKVSNGSFENVPMGVFNANQPKKNSVQKTIEINAADNTFLFDVPWKKVIIEFPCTVYNILDLTCKYVGVPLKTTKFPNSTCIVLQRPTKDMSCRDVVSYIAQMAGCFARMDRAGELEFKWMGSIPDTIIVPESRVQLTKQEKNSGKIKILYIKENVGESETQGDYLIDLSDNPFIQPQTQEEEFTLICNTIENCGDFSFYPCSCDWDGDPTLQAGDVIQQNTKDGQSFITYAAKTTYKYRNTSTIEANQNISVKTGATSGDVKDSSANSTVAVYTDENSSIITLSSSETSIIDIVFATVNSSNPIFSAAINFTITTAGTINFKYYIDNVEYYVTPKQTVSVGCCIVALHLPLAGMSGNSQHEIKVTMQSSDATGTIATRQVQASLFGQGLSTTKSWNGRMELKDTFDAFGISPKIAIAGFTATLTAPSFNTSAVINLSEIIPAVTISTGTITIAGFTTNILTERVVTGEKFIFDLAHSDNYNYHSYYIDTVSDAFKMRESYIFVGTETTIDSGKMLEIDIDTAQYKSVSAIVVGV